MSVAVASTQTQRLKKNKSIGKFKSKYNSGIEGTLEVFLDKPFSKNNTQYKGKVVFNYTGNVLNGKSASMSVKAVIDPATDSVHIVPCIDSFSLMSLLGYVGVKFINTTVDWKTCKIKGRYEVAIPKDYGTISISFKN